MQLVGAKDSSTRSVQVLRGVQKALPKVPRKKSKIHNSESYPSSRSNRQSF